jgi:hypothetical protein
MSRSDPEDAALRWQAFLIDGFDDWLPAATITAAQYPKANARQILRGMISDFYYPDGVEQTDDQIEAWMHSYALNTNAIVRDPKTGEVLGRMRDLQKDKDGNKRQAKVPPPVVDKVRARKLSKRKAKEQNKA